MFTETLTRWFSGLWSDPPEVPSPRLSERFVCASETIWVDWRRVHRFDDPKWQWTRVLYALVHPRDNTIVYVGKADFSSVRERYRCSTKDWLHDWMREEGLTRPKLLVGLVVPNEGRRLTSQKLADVESLITKRLRPGGNIQCKNTRIARPGLTVACQGNWPLERCTFCDR